MGWPRETNITVHGVDGIIESFDEHGRCTESIQHTRYPRNACGFCGALHPTNPDGWRGDDGLKVMCDDCLERGKI